MFNHSEKNLKDLLGQVISSNKKLAKGMATVTVEEAWHLEMGEYISKYTEKVDFRNGTLYVKIHVAALRDQLSKNQQRAIDNLNDRCGKDLIKKIVFG